MMMSIHEIPLIVDSDILAGAQNKSADGSSFEINLEDPIDIPSEANSVTVEVQEATIWNVIPNIITGVNDTFRMDDTALAGPFDAVIPQGLYDLTSLQQSVESALVAAGMDNNSFQFLPDNATQKVVIRLLTPTVSVDFNVAQTFHVILGWNGTEVLGPTGVPQEDFLAPNVAAFNTIDYFLIHSDIVPRGIRTNNTYSQTIAQVLITAFTSVGSQIVSTPFNPPKSPAWDLRGSIRKRIKFWLTDNNNRLVDTNNENWSARIIIKYHLGTKV